MTRETTIKWVFRYDKTSNMFRIFRLMWTRGVVGDGKGYSCKFSLGLLPRIWFFRRGFNEWHIIVLGFRLHYQCSYGGKHV